MRAKTLQQAALELIRRASCDLPADVEEALQKAQKKEKKKSPAAGALSVILDNVALARNNSTPICQDTGTNIFHIWYGSEWTPTEIEKAIRAATKKASKKGYLRLNVVDPISGANTGNNLGIHNPQLHFHYTNHKSLKMSLLLKGGGSENVSTQYKLPDSGLKAGRDLDGVRRCVVDAVFKAQGKGCAPGVIAVGIGGDRGSSYMVAKEQLLRKLGTRSALPPLAQLEKQLIQELNSLSIGPMGFGGKTTVLDVLVGHAHRIPACYFVSVAYMCWALRRRTLTIKRDLTWKVA
jgi:fumarate hydratase class I